MNKPEEAVAFMREVGDQESSMRSRALSDLQFSYGEQWPAQLQQSRELEARPCLTINETDAFIRQIVNGMRQQRPRIKVHAVDSMADPKIAEVITGLTRHVEVNSDADHAYDGAGDYACRMGFGYWRVVTDYVREDSFDQDIFIRPIENPFAVYFDPASTLPDGSDAERALITDRLTKAAFKKQYPGAQAANFQGTGVGDSADWLEEDYVRIAEYFYSERNRADLVALSDGSLTWGDRLPSEVAMRAAGLTVTGVRPSFRKAIKWCKLTAMDVLEERVWPGRYVPVIPCYGASELKQGRVRYYGVTRNARDPQTMVNFWNTAATETMAMTPKAKWLMAEGQDEDYEAEWQQANTSALPVLHYKKKDLAGNDADKPERLQPDPPPEGLLAMLQGSRQSLKSVIGMYDPEQNQNGPKSGKAIRAEQGQSDSGNFHFYDNLTRSIKHTGRIILDLVPHVYDHQRVMRIIGEDGSTDQVTLNEKSQKPDARGNPVDVVLNDVTVGTYDVVMDTGPGYDTKRLEAQEAYVTLMSGPIGEEVAKVGADLAVRMLDVPGMDMLADRLAAANPLADIDEKSDVPPQTQMQLKALQAQLQAATQENDQLKMTLKFRSDVTQAQVDGRLKEAAMNNMTKTHDMMSREQTDAQNNDADNRTWLVVENAKGEITLRKAAMDNATSLTETHIKADAEAERSKESLAVARENT